MSFASNRSPIRLSGVSRGRIVVGGGIKKGGFSMYGGSSKRRSKPRSSKKWYADIQRSMIVEEKRKQREENKLVKMQADLDLRRSVRRKIGKFDDTESMLFTQAKIDRYHGERLAGDEQTAKDLEKAMRSLPLLLFMISTILIFSPLWWIPVGFAILLMQRLTRKITQSFRKHTSTR